MAIADGARVRPRVGSLEWERAGGPALSVGQRVALLAGSAVVLATNLRQRLVWRLRGRRRRLTRCPDKVDLSAWAPPDTQAAREAERHLRQVSSPQMVQHSFRAYYFSAIEYQLAPVKPPLDREALYVAALLHDVGLFDAARPRSERCFTVASARVARQIAAEAGWDEARGDQTALAITTNLNPFVSPEDHGTEAHFMSRGGLVEVVAQEWKVHPDNLREILARHPRDGFAAETAKRVREEARRNPGGRFACFGPLFSAAVRWSRFDAETGE